MRNVKRTINFNCELECKGKCCTGITHILPFEVKKFMKYAPLLPNIFVINANYIKKDKVFYNNIKRSSVEIFIKNDLTGEKEKVFLFVDFIMGSWKNQNTCMLLKNGLCSVHEMGKPLKCQLLPISPLSPEQNMSYAYEKMRNFCIGVKPTDMVEHKVWENGKLINKSDKENLRKYYDLMEESKLFTSTYIDSYMKLDKNFPNFISKLNEDSKNGSSNTSFETTFLPTPELLELINVEIEDFIESQIKAIESFAIHDKVSYEESETLNIQYNILKLLLNYYHDLEQIK